MASKEKRKQVLNELGLSKKEMNRIWENCIELDKNLRNLQYQGISWKHLPASEIRKIPEIEQILRTNLLGKVQISYDKKGKPEIVLENMLSSVTRNRVSLQENETNSEISMEEEADKISETTDAGSFEQTILAKIDAGIPLTRDEIKELLFDGYEMDRSEGENRRWSRKVYSTVEIGGRFFMIVWEEGLTESQENEFGSQPYEVEKREYEKMVTVTEWKRIEREAFKEPSEDVSLTAFTEPEEDEELDK